MRLPATLRPCCREGRFERPVKQNSLGYFHLFSLPVGPLFWRYAKPYTRMPEHPMSGAFIRCQAGRSQLQPYRRVDASKEGQLGSFELAKPILVAEVTV